MCATYSLQFLSYLILSLADSTLPFCYGFIFQLWVFSHRRNKGFYLRTNDGIKRMNQAFEHEFFKRQRNESFPKILRILVECFVPLQLSV